MKAINNIAAVAIISAAGISGVNATAYGSDYAEVERAVNPQAVEARSVQFGRDIGEALEGAGVEVNGDAVVREVEGRAFGSDYPQLS